MLACVASVSVEQKERRRNGEKWGESKNKKDPPRPSYFCSRPIFRAGKTPKAPFLLRSFCSTETLATQANIYTVRLILGREEEAAEIQATYDFNPCDKLTTGLRYDLGPFTRVRHFYLQN